jgi:ATP-binding cassette subfamily B multidrug efflux pump
MRPEPDYFEETRLGKTYDARLLLRLYPLTRAHRRLLFGSIGLVVLITLLELALPYVTKLAIDRYIVPAADPASATISVHAADRQRRLRVDASDPGVAAVLQRYPHLARVEEGVATIPYETLSSLNKEDLAKLRRTDLSGLALMTGIFALLVVLDFLLNFVQSVVMEISGQRIMHDLRMKLFTHIQDLALEFFTRNPVGRLVTRTTSDVQNMYELFTSFISFVFKDLVLLAGIAAVMLALNWKLALVTFSVLPAVLIASMFFSKRARQIFRTLRVQVAEINTRFAETIGGMRVIQLFRQEANNFGRFAHLNQANYLSGMEQIRVLAVFMPLIEVLAVAAVALIVWYGGGQVLGEMLSLGALVAFISYIRMFFRPLRDLAEKYNILQNAMASAERIFLVLDTHTVLPQPTPPPVGRLPGLSAIAELRFEHVQFGYAPGEDVLHDISFALQQGETVAVVGPTGAGKTSLVNLIPRLYDPTAGRVTINGRDLRDYSSTVFRDRMALVMQDPFLFSGTIRDNIFQGVSDHAADQTDAIIEASNLKRLIGRLPEGLDTVLGEGGSSISTGERQLIAMARAFARNPQLILFDEATSAIDSQTEQWIQEALERLMRHRTALVVAHRLSTVRTADRILVMNRGRIIESGTHPALMDRRGFYYRLHQLQPEAELLLAK